MSIGIDLGTTFSCVAIINPNNEPETIVNFNGNRTTPSVIAYEDAGELVGEAAVDAHRSIPLEHVIYGEQLSISDSKRLIGRQFNDDSIQSDRKRWRFKIEENDGKPHIPITRHGSKVLIAPEQVSSTILKHMKDIAEHYFNDLNTMVTQAVVTVPAAFDQRQRNETLKAAKMAGFTEVKLINEPTAAALAYGMREKGNKTVLGTFDVSILKCKGGGHFEILSSFGHMHLGGQDIDNILVEYALVEYNRGRARKFPEENLRKMKRLTESCTKAKIALSSHDRPAMIYMDMANEDDEFSVTITRSKFNELIGGMIRGTLSIVDQALSRANLTERNIDHVVSTKYRMSQVFLPNLFLK